ncbi:MAG: hypothetical protein ABR573_09885 [Candidatus Dormibacteria bacterium]
MGVEEIGLVVVVWGVCALAFRDWIVKFDLVMRERATGDYFPDRVVEEQRRLLDRTARLGLAVGLLVFFLGAALRFSGHG